MHRSEEHRSHRRLFAAVALVMAVFVASCDDEPVSTPVNVAISSMKSSIYAGEEMPLEAEVEWIEERQDRQLQFEWSVDGSCAEIDNADSQTALLAGKAYGTAKVRLEVWAVDANGARTASATAEKEVAVLARLSPRSSGPQSAVDLLPEAVSSEIEAAGGAEWSSSDTDIAEIDPSTGEITPRKEGSTEITAAYGTDSRVAFRLDVAVPVESVSLQPESVRIQAGQKTVVRAVIVPEDATDRQVFWGSPQTGFIKVSFSGNDVELEGSRPGSGVLTVMTNDGGFTASVPVEVVETVRAASVQLSQDSLSLREGQNAVLTASVLPEDALVGSVTWSSSDPSVIGIRPDGNSCEVEVLRLPETDGHFFVKAISPDGPEASCAVNVVKVAVESVEALGAPDSPLAVGSQISLSANVLPADADDLSVTWRSSAPDVVAVGPDGVIEVLRLPEPDEDNPVVVTVKASSGVEDSVSIMVDVPLVSISVSGESAFAWDSQNALAVSYEPSNTTWDRTIYWSSDNPAVSVSDEGVLSASDAAKAVIAAVSAASDSIKSSISVSAVRAQSVEVVGSRAVTLLKGASKQLSAVVVASPLDAAFQIPVWSSSDPSKAAVSPAGEVTGLAWGDVEVVATSPVDTSKSDSFSVAVVDVRSVLLSQSAVSMKSGEELPLALLASVDVLPDRDAYKGLVWASDNDGVVEVDQTGKATAKAEGSAYVTVSSELNPSVKAVCKVGVGVNVRSVSVDQESLTVRYGQQSAQPLTATVDVSPADDSYRQVSWSAAADAKVSVDSDGMVIGLALGQTTVTATSIMDGTKHSTIPVTVRPYVGSVSIDSEPVFIRMNGSAALSASVSVLPENAPDSSRKVSWDTTNDLVAVVSSSGVVTPTGVGEAWITAASEEDPDVPMAYCKVEVRPSVSVSLNTVGPILLETGDAFQLSALVMANPEYNPDSTSNFGVTWSSDSSDVEVDQTGRVTAIRPGSATVTVVSDADPSGTASISVQVSPKFAQSLSISQSNISIDLAGASHSVDLDVIGEFVDPFEGDYKALYWESDDEDVATVDQNGVVTAHSDGSCTITVSTAYQGSDLSAECDVTVYTTSIQVSFQEGAFADVECGDSLALTPVVTAFPDIDANKVLVWSSTDSDVVSVNASTGELTVGVPGTATIRATSDVLSSSYAECVVTVEPKFGNALSISQDNAQIDLAFTANTVQLSVAGGYVVPFEAPYNGLSWTSDHDAIATVDQNGLVTAHANGDCVITASTSYGGGLSASCSVHVFTTTISVGFQEGNALDAEYGDEISLTPVVTAFPDTAANRVLVWSSTDSDVVSVNASTGELTVGVPGTATVRATSDALSSSWAECVVTVRPKFASSMALNASAIELRPLDAFQLSVDGAFVSPNTSQYNMVRWESSNDEVAMVGSDGYVIAVEDGECTITAYSDYEGSDLSATCGVTVRSLQVSIVLTLPESEDPCTSMSADWGDEIALEAHVTADPDEEENRAITWSSTNSDVVSVNASTGELTVNAPGTAVIRAASDVLESSYAECVVTINPIFAETLSLTPASPVIEPGATLQLATSEEFVTPFQSPCNGLAWSSSDASVATVDEETGLVTAIQDGECTITASSTYPGCELSASCKLIVSTVPRYVRLVRNQEFTVKSFASTYDGNTSVQKIWDGTVWYSTDGLVWTEWTTDTKKLPALTAGLNEETGNYELYLRGKGNTTFYQEYYYEDDPDKTYRHGLELGGSFTTYSGDDRFGTFEDGGILLEGNVMALLDYENLSDTIPSDNCFYKLFYAFSKAYTTNRRIAHTSQTISNGQYALSESGNLPICSIAEGFLPAIHLTKSCYEQMFVQHLILKEVPANLLPATTLAENCYRGMFSSCFGLVSPPALPATVLADGCYANMFYLCMSLQKVPYIYGASGFGPSSFANMYDMDNGYMIVTSGDVNYPKWGVEPAMRFSIGTAGAGACVNRCSEIYYGEASNLGSTAFMDPESYNSQEYSSYSISSGQCLWTNMPLLYWPGP